MLIQQSTAITIKFGPFLDSTDGNTVEIALTIQKADVRLSKNGGNMAAAAADQGVADAGAPYDELGFYDVSLDGTDTNTLGRLQVMVHDAAALSVWQEFMVLPANVYNSLVAGSDNLEVDTVLVEGADATDTIQASANDALVAQRLDHLVAVADADDPVDDSIIAKLAASDGDWSGFAEATDSLEAIRDKIDAISIVSFPTGANEFTYTVTDSVTGLPIEGVEVWFSTDIPGVNIVWKGDTDTFGVARDVNGDLPFLDTGTYRVWAQKSGYTFVNPDVEAVP